MPEDYSRFPAYMIPDGYYVYETDDVVQDANVPLHAFKLAAQQHARELNDRRGGPMYRYEVERVGRGFRVIAAEHGRRLPWYARWAVVPYQNKLLPIPRP